MSRTVEALRAVGPSLGHTELNNGAPPTLLVPQVLMPRVLNFLMTTAEARRALATARGGIRAFVWITVLRRMPRSRRCGIDEGHRRKRGGADAKHDSEYCETDHNMFLCAAQMNRRCAGFGIPR
jgi:hypothetical protein